METLVTRLRGLAKTLANDGFAGPTVEDVELAASLLELRDAPPLTDRQQFAAEERLAWDRYAAILVGVDDFDASDAARVADQLLDERRKRFGAGK